MSDSKKIKLLYVDDERVNLLAFKANFRRDYTVYTAESAEKGEQLLEQNEIHVVIADQRMPQMTGVQFFEKILPKHPDTIRILLTGFSDITAVIDAINKGKVYSYITKPWNEEELRRTIESANEAYQLQLQNKELEKKYRQLFELSSDPIIMLDAKARIIDANQSTINCFGYDIDELNTLDYVSLFDGVEVIDEIMDNIKSEQRLSQLTLNLITKDGVKVPCSVTSSDINLSDSTSATYQVVVKPVQ